MTDEETNCEVRIECGTCSKVWFEEFNCKFEDLDTHQEKEMDCYIHCTDCGQREPMVITELTATETNYVRKRPWALKSCFR